MIFTYEDLQVGTRFESHAMTVTTDDVLEFAHRFDPQIAHADPVAARATFFGAHVASGWHTCALTMRLMFDSMPLAGGIVGGGVDELRWPHALRPGDTIHLESEVVEMRTLKSRASTGLVKFRCVTLNQRGEAVQTMLPNLFVSRKTA
jgi:acyl dehydratase